MKKEGSDLATEKSSIRIPLSWGDADNNGNSIHVGYGLDTKELINRDLALRR